MASLSEYFAANRYKPKYFLGDRVRGIWNDIPFTGSVAIDTQVYEGQDPVVMVFLDLPLQHAGSTITLLRCTHEQVNSI